MRPPRLSTARLPSFPILGADLPVAGERPSWRAAPTFKEVGRSERLLTRGHAGDAVFELQEILEWKIGVELAIDGLFGAETEEAVRAFQRAVGLDADGVVGPATLRALAS